MTYRTIHTLYGLRRQASGAAIQITHMALGDGGGVEVEPNPQQTQLVREVYRAPVNRVYQLEDDPDTYVAELVLPAAVGGFVMREAGIYDADGGLFIVGNLPATVKPTAADGAFSDTGVRLLFKSSNASVVTLQVDPNVALATHAWVGNNVTAAALLPGGTTGQVLAKTSNADGDCEWRDPSVANVVVDVIEERQDLVDGQVEVALNECTTRGLVLYIDGLRVPDDEWTKHPTDPTKLSLNAPVAGTHELIAAQNEPTGDAPAPLERSRNLADVESAATARANLDVFSRDETRQMAPPGMVGHFARRTAPPGWLKANGAAVSRTAYAALFAAIGTTFGLGDGFNTFNLPDLRGEFMRGWDDGRGIDVPRELGSSQSDSNKSHTHTATASASGAHTHSGSTAQAGSHAHTGGTNWAGQHGHSGEIGSAGKHAHPMGWGKGLNGPYGVSGSYNVLGPAVTDNNNAEWESYSSGAHVHSLKVNEAGSHQHEVSVSAAGAHSHDLTTSSAGAHAHDITVSVTGGTESRPRNVALLACIKY